MTIQVSFLMRLSYIPGEHIQEVGHHQEQSHA
jgi:hypothetical protein